MTTKFSKIQQYVLTKLADGEWHEEGTLNCTHITIKALERKGAVELHPKFRDGRLSKWRLKNDVPPPLS